MESAVLELFFFVYNSYSANDISLHCFRTFISSISCLKLDSALRSESVNSMPILSSIFLLRNRTPDTAQVQLLKQSCKLNANTIQYFSYSTIEFPMLYQPSCCSKSVISNRKYLYNRIGKYSRRRSYACFGLQILRYTSQFLEVQTDFTRYFSFRCCSHQIIQKVYIEYHSENFQILLAQ